MNNIAGYFRNQQINDRKTTLLFSQRNNLNLDYMKEDKSFANYSNSPKSKKGPSMDVPETIKWLKKRYPDRVKQFYFLNYDRYHPESKGIVQLFLDLSKDKKGIPINDMCEYMESRDIRISKSDLANIIRSKNSDDNINMIEFQQIMMSATLNQKFRNSNNQSKQQITQVNTSFAPPKVVKDIIFKIEDQGDTKYPDIKQQYQPLKQDNILPPFKKESVIKKAYNQLKKIEELKSKNIGSQSTEIKPKSLSRINNREKLRSLEPEDEEFSPYGSREEEYKNDDIPQFTPVMKRKLKKRRSKEYSKRPSLESIVNEMHFDRKRNQILENFDKMQETVKGKSAQKINLLESLLNLPQHSNLNAKRSLLFKQQHNIFSQNKINANSSVQSEFTEEQQEGPKKQPYQLEEQNFIQNSSYIESYSHQQSEFQPSTFRKSSQKAYQEQEDTMEDSIFDEANRIASRAKREAKISFNNNLPSYSNISRDLASSFSQDRSSSLSSKGITLSTVSNAANLRHPRFYITPKIETKPQTSNSIQINGLSTQKSGGSYKFYGEKTSSSRASSLINANIPQIVSARTDNLRAYSPFNNHPSKIDNSTFTDNELQVSAKNFLGRGGGMISGNQSFKDQKQINIFDRYSQSNLKKNEGGYVDIKQKPSFIKKSESRQDVVSLNEIVNTFKNMNSQRECRYSGFKSQQQNDESFNGQSNSLNICWGSQQQ